MLGREALWAGLIALAVAIPLAAWVASRISARLESVVAFARRIAEGDLDARLDRAGEDELSAMEAALNQTAERLGKNFAELESRRQELAAMLDSMQEAVVAITPEGYVRWSNAVMQRIAGTQIHPGRPLVHSVRDPELLACVMAPWSAAKSALAAPACLLPDASLRSTPHRCPAAARSPFFTTSPALRRRKNPGASLSPT